MDTDLWRPDWRLFLSGHEYHRNADLDRPGNHGLHDGFAVAVSLSAAALRRDRLCWDRLCWDRLQADGWRQLAPVEQGLAHKLDDLIAHGQGALTLLTEEDAAILETVGFVRADRNLDAHDLTALALHGIDLDFQRRH